MISIIVPVYNVEKYLDECVQSILKQTYQDFELVLVDDGSTDSSFRICETYADRDDRVKFVSITNGGANHARKIGVNEATGDYIMFIDSDDTIDSNALDNLLAVAVKNPDADVVVGHMEEYKEVLREGYLIDLLCNACNVAMYFKLYRADILKQYFMDIPRSLNYGEDLLQNVNIARYVKKVIYSGVEYYNYRMVETSICHTMQFCQEYEHEYHRFLKTLLFEPSFCDSLSEEQTSSIHIAWYHCQLNGLKNLLLNSSSFNFHDSSFLHLKRILQPYVSSLSIDEKILLYTNPRLCKTLIKSHDSYCKFKGLVKKYIRYK